MLVAAHTNKATKEKKLIKAELSGREIESRYEKNNMHRANS